MQRDWRRILTDTKNGVNRRSAVREWYGVVAPANTPAGIVMRLNHEINRALALPDVRERFASQGADAVIMTPTQLSGYFKSEVAKWAQVVVASGARAE
jgi:tripartite-type tricarboxylate transporter receptor subunit TctC